MRRGRFNGKEKEKENQKRNERQLKRKPSGDTPMQTERLHAQIAEWTARCDAVVEALSRRVADVERSCRRQGDAHAEVVSALEGQLARLEARLASAEAARLTKMDEFRGCHDALRQRVDVLTPQIDRHAAALAAVAQRVEDVALLAPVRSPKALQDSVLERGVRALMRWTSAHRAVVVYDSVAERFTAWSLFSKIRDRSNIAVVAFTADGDVFGGFYRVAVTEADEDVRDPNVFVFSFESRGRCATPQQFPTRHDKKRAMTVRFRTDGDDGLFSLCAGTGGVFLGTELSNSFCCGLSSVFEGVEDTTLTGASGQRKHGPFHRCLRLVAVHLP